MNLYDMMTAKLPKPFVSGVKPSVPDVLRHKFDAESPIVFEGIKMIILSSMRSTYEKKEGLEQDQYEEGLKLKTDQLISGLLARLDEGEVKYGHPLSPFDRRGDADIAQEIADGINYCIRGMIENHTKNTEHANLDELAKDPGKLFEPDKLFACFGFYPGVLYHLISALIYTEAQADSENRRDGDLSEQSGMVSAMPTD